jgi:hypothetical protein
MKTLRLAAWLSAGLLTTSFANAAESPVVGGTLPAPGAPPRQVTVSPDSPVQAIIAQPAPMAGCDFNGEACRSRRMFESDRAFDGFIGPITNPILAKDPRSLTEARALFINNVIPGDHPLGGGDFQVYALQLRLALTERLTLIADKDGYASINPNRAANSDGWLNLAAGLKYTLVRDVENQFLAAVGFMFEPQTGEAAVFQSHGDGLFTFFGTVGKEFGCKNHVIANLGYQVPINGDENSSMIYSQLHFDRQMFGWLYPLFEVNWYHWVAGGNRGLPPALGEGDGLLNLGTSGVAGNDLVTMAVGLKAKLNCHAEVGAAWEFPVSNRNDLIDNRLTCELILRY